MYIFCNRVGVVLALECSQVNEQKNGRKAELGDYFYRSFIIWFKFWEFCILRMLNCILISQGYSTVKYKTIIQELDINY